jgi:hypothetical protein
MIANVLVFDRCASLVACALRIRSTILPLVICSFLCFTCTNSPAQRYGSYVISQPKQRIDKGLRFIIKSGPLPNIKLPRLTSFPDAAVMRAVNADLDDVRRSLVEKARNCRGDGEDKSDWQDLARVDLFTRDVLSIYIGISYYCGGPHPDDEYMPLTYNMRTGKRFDFQKDAAQLFTGDSFPFEELLRLYIKHYGAPGECPLTDIRSDTVDQLYIHFGADGLILNPDLPHVMAACGPEVVIPYSGLKPLVKPDSPFASLFTAR